jgi:hypothetical protein
VKFGGCLIKEFFFFGGRADAVQEVLLLQLAKMLQNLRSLFGLELWPFGKDFSFAGFILSIRIAAGARRSCAHIDYQR